MQVTQRQQLKLFEPFFNEELDYKNDSVLYISVGLNSSVTPKNNNNISTQNKKYHRDIDNIFNNFTCSALNNPCFEALFYFDSNHNLYSFDIPYEDFFIQYEQAKDFSILHLGVA